MELRGEAVTGRRQFLCGCCATIASVGSGARFAAAATAPVVVPVERAPFHLEVFENEYVRFLNVLIPPGKVGAYHRHSIDFAYLILESTDRLEITVLDKPMALVLLKTGQVVFGGYSKAPLIHQLVNAGQGSLHVNGIEIFDSQSGRFSPSTRADVPAYTPVLDNERVRGWRLVLQPGESAAAITQTAPGIRMVVQGGDTVESARDEPDHELNLVRGDFVWQAAGTTRAVRNVGTSPVEWVEFELK
jgi:mannose-6-phosphate isomerase-like protein (cupin superfamily)